MSAVRAGKITQHLNLIPLSSVDRFGLIILSITRAPGTLVEMQTVFSISHAQTHSGRAHLVT
jgi:hypothetical protein